MRISLEETGDFAVVGEAGDGAAAVELAHRFHPDAALIDLAMPVMDGLQAISAIRADSPATVIVALSGFSAGQMEAAALAAGADAYFCKADSLAVLTERLKDLCATTARKELDAT